MMTKDNTRQKAFVPGDLVSTWGNPRGQWSRNELLPSDSPTRRVVQGYFRGGDVPMLTVVVPEIQFEGVVFVRTLFPDGVLSWIVREAIRKIHLKNDVPDV